MSLRNWIRNQLTASRGNEAAWEDLAVSIVDTIEAHAESYIEKLKARPSLYEMDKESLSEDFKELFKIFPLGEVEDDDLSHVVMQRRDEIHFKRTLYPMIATMAREFNGIEVGWESLYAPKDQELYPYGTILIPESHVPYSAFPREDLFLTSRGVIRLPLLDIQRGTNENMEAIERRIKQVLHPLIPLRIVLDGQIYLVQFNISELVELVTYRDWTETSVRGEDAEHFVDAYSYVSQGSLLTKEMPVDRIYNTRRMTAHALDSISIDTVSYIFNVPTVYFSNAIEGKTVDRLFNSARMSALPLDSISIDTVSHINVKKVRLGEAIDGKAADRAYNVMRMSANGLDTITIDTSTHISMPKISFAEVIEKEKTERQYSTPRFDAIRVDAFMFGSLYNSESE